MTQRILCILLPLSVMMHICRAQGSAELMLPNPPVLDGTEQALRVNVADVSWTYPDMKSFVTTVQGTPGLRYFSPVLLEGQTKGYIELNYATVSATELRDLLRSVFCTLKINRIKINQTVFDNCQHIEIQ